MTTTIKGLSGYVEHVLDSAAEAGRALDGVSVRVTAVVPGGAGHEQGYVLPAVVLRDALWGQLGYELVPEDGAAAGSLDDDEFDDGDDEEDDLYDEFDDEDTAVPAGFADDLVEKLRDESRLTGQLEARVENLEDSVEHFMGMAAALRKQNETLVAQLLSAGLKPQGPDLATLLSEANAGGGPGRATAHQPHEHGHSHQSPGEC